MKKLIATFVNYPFYANLIVAFLIIAGGYSFLHMKKSFFPERASRNMSISVSYPGASPKEMEEGITTRIEEAIRGIVGIKEFTSTSSENSARIDIETTGEYDLDETLQEVKNAIDAISSMPQDAERPVIYKRRTTTPAMFIGLSGDVGLETLKTYAQQIEDDFLASGVMSQVNLSGYPDLEISVEVTEENLLRYNLTFDEISAAIANNNRDISAGQIKSEDEEILIRSRARSVDPNDIANIILRANDDGSHLRIGDIATVKRQFADVSSATYMNGKPSIRIQIQKLPEEDLEEISLYVNDYIDNFNARDLGVTLHATFDFLEVLKSRLHLLYENGSLGLILVVLTLGFFLNTALSLWVAWGIPASFLAMFIMAQMAGITVNMISLFGMILVIGILVDDGIVIAENIFTHYERGKPPKQAAVDGTMEVLPAVITSVTTTVVAFSPLFFVSGRMEFMYEMAFVVVASLGFSLFESFLVLPAHISSPHVLRTKRREHKHKNIRYYLDKIVTFMRDGLYGRLLRIIINWKWAVLATPIAIIMISVGLFGGDIIKTTYFPTIPFDSFDVEIAFTPGSGEKQTMEYLRRFERAIWQANEELTEEYNQSKPFIDYTFLNMGSAFSGQERGSHTGSVSAMLRDMEGSPISSFQIRDRVRKIIGDVPEADKYSIGARSRWGSPVAVSLLGRDLEELDKAKNFLYDRLQNIPTISNITENNAIGKQEVRLHLKPQAYFLGLDHNNISRQVRQGFFGGQAQRLQDGKDELRVYVRYPKKDRLNLGQFEAMKIKTARGFYPLTELTDYTIERGPVSINRYNGSREARIDADLTDPYDPVPPILAEIDQTIIPELKAQFPGVRVLYMGQQKDNAEATGQMTFLFGTAFALIVVILMIHFKSFSQPLIIICMIPLAILGASWGHGVEGLPVSILSMWGMVALSGIIINDAVVFLSKYNSCLLEGMKVKEAVYCAGVSRFRAILLTTLTTVFGLYPIVLEKSFQAQFLKPMAVSLAYGVMVGTSFILLFFPVYILVLNDIKVIFKWMLTGRKPTPEEVEVAIQLEKSVMD